MEDKLLEALKELTASLPKVDPREEICLICQRKAVLEPFLFGLVKGLSTKRDWIGLGKRFAIATAVSIPLSFIGFRALPNPIANKTMTGELLQLELRICAACKEHRTSRFRRSIKLTRTDYACHPSWEEAHRLGYDYLVPCGELWEWQPRRT